MFRQPITWSELERVRQDMDRLLDSAWPRLPRVRPARFPTLNVWTNDEEGVVVTAELPGVDPESLKISATADTLTISGSRRPAETAESASFHRREIPYGEFSRTLQLPYTVNTAKVEATAKDGYLTITLPRAEAEKPKQIAVNVG